VSSTIPSQCGRWECCPNLKGESPARAHFAAFFSLPQHPLQLQSRSRTEPLDSPDLKIVCFACQPAAPSLPCYICSRPSLFCRAMQQHICRGAEDQQADVCFSPSPSAAMAGFAHLRFRLVVCGSTWKHLLLFVAHAQERAGWPRCCRVSSPLALKYIAQVRASCWIQEGWCPAA